MPPQLGPTDEEGCVEAPTWWANSAQGQAKVEASALYEKVAFKRRMCQINASGTQSRAPQVLLQVQDIKALDRQNIQPSRLRLAVPERPSGQLPFYGL